MWKSPFCLIVLSLLTAGCNHHAPAKPAMKPPEVLVTPAVEQTITDFAEFTGNTETRNMIEIKARVTGYLDKVFFKDGDTVKEGDLLCEIDPRPYQVEVQRTEAALKQASVRFSRAETDFARAMVLRQSRSIAPEDFEKFKADRGAAEADIAVAQANLAKAKLDLQFTKVRVPTLDNGTKSHPSHPRMGAVGRRMKDPGNLIKADDTLLTTIVTLDPMYVYFDVDERTSLTMRDLIKKKKIKSINEMTFNFEFANDEGTFQHHGRIDFEDNRLDTGTGTLKLRGFFDNARGFAPGLFVRLRLLMGAPRKAILVPERALGTDQGQKFLYVVKQETSPDGQAVFKAEYRGGAKLELGPMRDGWRVIEKGVAAGEPIVWSGLQRVRRDANITPKQQAPPGAK